MIFAVWIDRIAGFDVRENDTAGFLLGVQVGPIVFEWWFSLRKFWR